MTVLLDGGMGQELIRRSTRHADPQWSAHVLARLLGDGGHAIAAELAA